jgi:hypothetical protein
MESRGLTISAFLICSGNAIEQEPQDLRSALCDLQFESFPFIKKKGHFMEVYES